MEPVGGRLASAARRLIGRPYRFRGQNEEAGLDCVGLIQAARRMAGLEPCAVGAYREPLEARMIVRALHRHAVPVARAVSGDLAWIEDEGRFHLGMVAGREVVHADRIAGRVIATPLGRLGIRSFWRFREIA